MVKLLREDEIVDAEEIGEEAIKALGDSTRLEITEILKEGPNYPSKIAERMDLERQKVYYHIEILENADIIEQDHQEKKSGGLATFYRLSKGGMALDFEKPGRKISIGKNKDVMKFLHPLIEESRMNGYTVVGSPDEHGPDQVRARDGHLAGEIAIKLGEYCSSDERSVKMDTEVNKEELYEENLLILGGVLTNTVAKRFNGAFPVSFEGESFPYRKIQSPEDVYTEPEIGFLAKTENPEDSSREIFIVAGIRNRGTEAAVKAFKDIEKLVKGYSEGEFYCVVRGLDLDGDGEIDDYETVEKSL